MRRARLKLFLSSLILFCATSTLHSQALNANFARDPQQPVDQEYTDQIHKYTTDPSSHVPAGGLSAGIEDGTHADEGAGRRRWRA